jgi:hypothetical protein
MLPIYLLNKHSAKVLLGFAVFFIAMMVFPNVYAQQGGGGNNALLPLTAPLPSAQTMLVNIGEQIPNLMRLITAVAYVMGLYCIIHGVILMKHLGEARTQMSHEHSISKPIAYLAVGAGLTYLPSTIQVGLSTFWVNPNPYGYLQMQSDWFQFINVCFLIVQFVGVLAVIRGLLLLKDIGGGHGQGQGPAKGLTHVIGGLLCINIYQFVQVIMITLGLQSI